MQGERWRVGKFQRQEELSDMNILLQIWKYSWKLFFIFLILFFFWFVFDNAAPHLVVMVKKNNTIRQWLIKYLFLPDIGSIKMLLGVLASVISAILGIIFALYAVGFRLSTERYSEIVTKFIEDESVVQWFFQLLIFTDIFIIATLFKIQFINQIPYASLILIIFLIFSSLMGILILKNHYLRSIKPESLFSRLFREIKICIDSVSNIKSCFYKSWRVVKSQRNEADKLLRVTESLYEDLARHNNWQDAQYSPLSIGKILQYYLQRKRYIDRSHAWWFPQKYEKVHSDNLSMYTLKINYELQGKGPLHIEKTYYEWFEDEIVRFLRQVNNSLSKNYQPKIVASLIESYKKILVGDISRDNLGRFTKYSPGAFQSQEFEMFNKVFDDFINLFDHLDYLDVSVMTDYLNTFFTITSTINGGFEWDKINRIIERLSILTKKDLITIDIPTLFRKILIDYYERLEVERIVEGKIITPVKWLESEVENELKNQEKVIIEQCIKKSADHLEQIIKICFEKGQKEILLHYLGMQWTWIQQLKQIKYHGLAEEISKRAVRNAGYLLDINDQHLIEKVEIRQQVEYILFPALINGEKSLFINSTRAFLIVHRILMPTNIQDEKQLNLYAWIRTSLIIGGMTYIISELNQDDYFIREYAKLLEAAFKPDQLVNIFKIAVDTPPELIYSETMYFHHWFRQIYSKIEAIPKKFVSSQGALGSKRLSEHPSIFIQKHSESLMFHLLERHSIKEFINYLEKRHQIKRLVEIFKKWKNV